jgi:membrane protein
MEGFMPMRGETTDTEQPDDPPKKEKPFGVGRLIRAFFGLLVETFQRWNADRVPRMGAALSFYTVFSLAPLSVLMLLLVSMAVGRGAAQEEIVGQVRALVSSEGADLVAMILSATASAEASSSPWMTALGIGVLLIGASGMFGELQDSLNQIWGVSSKWHPVLVLIKERAFAFVMILVLACLMFVSFLYSAVSAAVGGYVSERFPGWAGPWEWGTSAVSLLAMAMLFALIFRAVPYTRIYWKDVWLGALLTAFMFLVGKVVLGFYFGRSALAAHYGAAGALIIVLVWVYYSAQILLFGAEFTRVYALRYGSRQDETVKELQEPSEA